MNNPETNDWQKLHQTAIQFQKNAPWNWIGSDDLFAVENPDTGEIAYCSVMGAAKEQFGIVAFLGEKGYRRFLELISQGPESYDFDKHIMTPLLSFMLVSRQEMDKEDMAVINSLGLKFRGAKAWPQFRSQRPGYTPWFLEKEEAVFLTTIIERALVISDQVSDEGLDLYEKVDEDKVLTCRYRDGQWIEEWRVPKLSAPSMRSTESSVTPVKEAELFLLRNSKGKPGGSWEMDIFIMPLPIGISTERPHFPLCFLAVDKKLGIVGVEMTEPWLSSTEKRENILKILRKGSLLPRDIRVKSQAVKDIIEPLATGLGIKISIEPLTFLEGVKADIEDHLAKSMMR
jgi:hypothetical protein